MKVLFVASEAAPIVKLGGLGDVAGSLPIALNNADVKVDVVIPYFSFAKIQDLKIIKSMDITVSYEESTHIVEVHKTKLPGSNVTVFMLRNKDYIVLNHKDSLTNVPETTTFSFFSKAVVELIKAGFNTYDIVHCNDWHTGLITHLLQDELGTNRPATLFTVHNLAYQGIGDLDLVHDIGFYPGQHRLIDWDTADGDINFMLQGISSSDFVNTVSPSYATEILNAPEGDQLKDVLKSREGRFTGILNGVDYSQFVKDYDVTNWKKAKNKYKGALQEKMSLKKSKKPIVAFISRLDPNQKGLDILYDSIPAILELDMQFILLGTGEPFWEEKFKSIAQDYPEDVSINIMFNIELANQIYKGSDFLMVPSRYEPCGLIQMIAMSYGTLPIVHKVGGLKDSVEDGVDGFCFDDYSSTSLSKALKRAAKIYKNTDNFTQMVENAMNKDFSWDKSAEKYKDLYTRLLKIHSKV